MLLSILGFSMIEKRINITFILIAFLIISLPSFGMIISDKQVMAIDENRALNSLPEGSPFTVFLDTGEYAATCTEWFNDRFGCRDIMIRAKNEIVYRLFGDLGGDNGLYAGDDGYLAYKQVFEEQVVNESVSDDELNGIVDILGDVKLYLENRGIEFYFMIPPQKNECFPERFTQIPITRPDANNYLELCDRLRKNDGFIDTLQVLREAERLYPTYYRTDFHWNGYGGTAAFTPIVNDISSREYSYLDAFGTDDYVVYKEPGFKGGLLKNFPSFEDWSEDAIMTRVTVEHAGRDVDDSDQNAPNGAIHLHNLNKDAPLGTMLLIGDSYTAYMLYSKSGILDRFKDVYYVNINNETYEGSIKNYQDIVDYVVYERIESGIPIILEELVKIMR